MEQVCDLTPPCTSHSVTITANNTSHTVPNVYLTYPQEGWGQSWDLQCAVEQSLHMTWPQEVLSRWEVVKAVCEMGRAGHSSHPSSVSQWQPFTISYIKAVLCMQHNNTFIQYTVPWKVVYKSEPFEGYTQRQTVLSTHRVPCVQIPLKYYSLVSCT